MIVLNEHEKSVSCINSHFLKVNYKVLKCSNNYRSEDKGLVLYILHLVVEIQFVFLLVAFVIK